MTLPYTPFSETYYLTNSAATNNICFYVIVLGGPPSTSVVNISLAFNYEVEPTTGSALLMPVKFPNPSF